MVSRRSGENRRVGRRRDVGKRRWSQIRREQNETVTRGRRTGCDWIKGGSGRLLIPRRLTISSCLVNVENVPRLLLFDQRRFHLFHRQTDPCPNLARSGNPPVPPLSSSFALVPSPFPTSLLLAVLHPLGHFLLAVSTVERVFASVAASFEAIVSIIHFRFVSWPT